MVNTDEFIDDAKAEIRDQLGDSTAVIALSGASTPRRRRPSPTRRSATSSSPSTSTRG